MNDTAIQAYAAVTFALSGIIAYFIYKLLTEAQKFSLLNGLQIPLDAAAGLSIGLCFIAAAHFLFDGVLKLYMAAAFAGGMLLAKAVFGKLIELIIATIIKGVIYIMNKVSEFFKKVWNKIKAFAQSITKGGKKDEQTGDKDD
jgi:hypothetical protein